MSKGPFARGDGYRLFAGLSKDWSTMRNLSWAVDGSGVVRGGLAIPALRGGVRVYDCGV
jgi:hypothetical protein